MSTTALIGVAIAWTQSVSGFSPIWSIDGWDTDRLAEAGISVSPWKHDKLGESPPLQWVRVAFDCSDMPDGKEVLMTAWIRSDGEESVFCRAQRTSGESVELILALKPDYVEHSRLNILMFRELEPGRQPGFNAEDFPIYGYELSTERILDLAYNTVN